MSSRIERLRNSFLVVFFLLVISIIFTPILVRGAFFIFPEEVLESILLLFQISVAWKIFRLYEGTVKNREEEIEKLEGEYQKREKELLEAFAYLGKVNVQISLIQSFLQKIKAPSSRKEAENYINEILKITLSLSGKKWATLRAIDIKTLQTAKEYWAKANPQVDTSGIKISNKDVSSWGKEGDKCDRKGYCVYASAGSKLSSFKVFLVFLNGEKMDQDIEGFLRAAANQCEVLLTMFDFKEKK